VYSFKWGSYWQWVESFLAQVEQKLAKGGAHIGTSGALGWQYSIKMNKEYKLLKSIELSRIDTMDSFIPNIIKKDLDLMHKLCINNVSNLIIETILSSNNIKYREKLFDIILYPNDRETKAQNIIDIPNFNYIF
ncbi:hypothetical protein, partial [Globicatella sanguinis]